MFYAQVWGMKNPVVFWELASNDAEESVRFFREVFEWEFSKEGLIHFVDPGEPRRVPGGVFTLRRARLPFMCIYIEVEDVDEMAVRVVEHGGSIRDPPAYMPNGAYLCLFNDPSGVTHAMIQKR